MSGKYKFQNPDVLYFITFSVVGWLDLFIRREYRDLLLDCFRFCQSEKGLDIYGWTIMTSHVHMIISSHGLLLPQIMRDMKKFSSTALRKAIDQHPGESRKEWMLEIFQSNNQAHEKPGSFHLWQAGNHPIELFDMKMAHQKLDYVHNNAVVAGFVEKPEDYLYSSARDYFGKKGLLQIQHLDGYIV